MQLLQLLLLHAATALVVPPARLVVLGPGSPEVQLITAKLAARAAYDVSLVTKDDGRAPRLMYGTSELPDGAPRLACIGSAIGNALARADAVVLVAETLQMGGGSSGAATVLDNSPGLRRLAVTHQPPHPAER